MQPIDDDDLSSFDNAVCFKETDDAILVQLDDGEEHWIPKSVVHDDSEIFEQGSDVGTLVVAGWWAREHELE